MGKLVRFDKPERPAPAQTGLAAVGEGGQVLIFTGVRYERMQDALPKQGPNPAKRRRKRG